jgi:hypothetical protein
MVAKYISKVAKDMSSPRNWPIFPPAKLARFFTEAGRIILSMPRHLLR